MIDLENKPTMNEAISNPKTDDDVWAEELSKIGQEESPYLPDRNIIQRPNNK